MRVFEAANESILPGASFFTGLAYEVTPASLLALEFVAGDLSAIEGTLRFRPTAPLSYRPGEAKLIGFDVFALVIAAGVFELNAALSDAFTV